MKVAIVAPYPRSRDSHGEEGLGGVASYTRNLAQALLPHVSLRLLSPTDGPEGERADGPIVVQDVKREGRRVAEAVKALAEDPDLDAVHVQFEQHLFGGMAQNLLLANALGRLKRAKRVVLTLHQVPDLGDVNRKFLKENGFPPLPSLARAWMRFQYRRLAANSHQVVVHEAVLATRLKTQYGVPASRVTVVPHGVERRALPLSQEEAKARLGVSGKKVVLYFGYVTGYKGVDLLVEALEGFPEERREGLAVVIAGKVPDRKLEKGSFRETVEDLEARIAGLGPWVSRKGFLSEADISLHLAAADVVLFPYRNVFGASGPLSLTVAHGRPFLASDAFRGLIPCERALFERTPAALRARLEAFLADAALRAEIQETSHRMRDEASWPRVAERTKACYAPEGGAPA
ncbi:MAG TPA: glycosyltransferase [Candidatus Thermoplasmatota archaeon]|nr:glycosyltransferase [Candidatus Thermoplasmatota archaeon]